MKAFAVLVCICVAAFARAQTAQGIPSDPTTVYDQVITVPANPDAPTKYDAPDIPKGWINWAAFDGKYFSYKFTIVALLDYDAFWQDSNSIEQVGSQRDQWDLRSERFSLSGRIGSRSFPVNYIAAVEYKGFDRPPDSQGWGSTDLALTVPVVRPAYGSITFGKTKETFSYEMVGDAANLPQMERLLTPFFTSRNVGVRYFNTVAHKRITIGGGWFNDWWTKGNPYDTSSNHYTGRVSFLPVLSSDGSKYVHLGFATRWIGATNGQLQYTARPESNVTSPYPDTGKFNAKSATNYGFEGLANKGPVSVLAEYVYTTTNAPTVGNPDFYGVYVTGNWYITGEHRPYDPSVGYARRVIPLHKYGAWELVGRIGRVNLTNKAIQGGVMDIYSGNISWWPNRRYRVALGAGNYTLNRLGVIGSTIQFHGRIQWIF